MSRIFAELRFAFNLLAVLCLLSLGFFILIDSLNKQRDRFFNLTKFETARAKGVGNYFKTCMDLDKIIFPHEYGEFFQIDTAKVISQNPALMQINESNGLIFGTVLAANVTRVIAYKAALGSGIGTIFAVAALAIEYTMMSEACSRLYLIAPHDEINRRNGAKCEMKDGVVKWAPANAKGAVSEADVPYFYKCTGCPVQKEAKPNPAHWGCRKFAGDFACTGSYAANESPNNVGKIIVEYYPSAAGNSEKCSANNRKSVALSPGQISWTATSPYPLYAYYSDSLNGGVQLCAMTPYTLFPIRIGCIPAAPPLEPNYYNPSLLPKVNRCAYLAENGRPDLAALADTLPNIDSLGRSSEPIKKFLTGDFHLASTVVGCVQDLFYQNLVNPVKQLGNDKPGLYQTAQERMRDIVLAVLTLYVSLVAINIMSNPQEPKAAELIMHLIKMSLVVFFTFGDGWYQEVAGGQNTPGLYKTLLHAPNELANLFMQAHAINDPANRCGYRYADSTELLGERNIPNANNFTYGWGSNIHLSVWDMVDCKVMSYMNFGSCEFNIFSPFALLPTLFSVHGITIAIFGFFYVFIIFLTILRLVCAAVLMIAILSLLIFISPIIFCFGLFNYTKETFNTWLRNVLSFMLFPAVLFGYLSFMFTVFDGILYGQNYFNATNSYNITNGSIDLNKACPDDNNSLYCVVARDTKQDPCAVNGVFRSATSNRELTGQMFNSFLKLALFAFIFYIMLDTIMKFLSYILSIPGNISELSSSGTSLNLASVSGNLAKKVPNAALRGAGGALHYSGEFINSVRRRR
jgi:type IV secretion system protein VirB6